MGFLRRLKWRFKDLFFEIRMSNQRRKKGYADCDCWGMNYWFSSTFAKMIRELRDMKHGHPELPFEEVDNFPVDWVEEMSKDIIKVDEKKGFEEEDFDIFDGFYRWQLILTRIAWCLEQASDEVTDLENEYEEEYNRQVWGDTFDDVGKNSFNNWWEDHMEVVSVDKKGKPKLYRLKTNEPDENIKEKYWKKEEENNKYREDMKNEAFDLLKKYFYNLWD